jgi:nitroreductase/FMN reductase (NADPH)/FMN reductase [NAD(P)H]
VFCADVRRWYEAFVADDAAEPREPGVGDALLAVVDATVAAQNAVVAAEALGLGSCYIGDILENAEAQRDILALPPYVMPACMLVVGHPTQQQRNRTKPRRFKLDTVVFEDRYRAQGAGEVAGAIAYKNEGRRETIAQFCARKWNSDFSREMTRSVRAWLSGFPFEG